MKTRVAVLGSGKGSNFEAIAEFAKSDDAEFEVVLVLSDKPDALILEKADKFGIKSKCIGCTAFKTKLDEQAENQYIKALKDEDVDVVVLAGFMRVIKPKFLSAFVGRIINIHPSILPAFAGVKAWQQALDYGVKYTGCTVHLVNEVVDGGAILEQAVVEVFSYDTYDTLHRRIQEAEHKLYPQAINEFAKKLV